jgi:hypothetical protein
MTPEDIARLTVQDKEADYKARIHRAIGDTSNTLSVLEDLKECNISDRRWKLQEATNYLDRLEEHIDRLWGLV